MLRDRRLAKTHASFFDGGIEAATRQYDANPSPDLLIIESRDGAEAIFAQLDNLAHVCRAETHLVLISSHNDVGLYRALTKQGVREYLPHPVVVEHLLESVIAVCADPDELKLGRLISFIAASGGAGSTTLANNVAWCLGKLYDGEATLVDLDLVFGTMAMDFNLESPENAAQALAQADRLDEQLLARILGKYNDNLGVLTAPGDCATSAEIDLEAMETMLKQLRQNANWVVADLPHYWSGWVRHALDASDEIVVTAVPTLASLRNAKSVIETHTPRRRNDAPVRFVLNPVGRSPKTDIPAKDFAATLGAALAVIMPHDPGIFSEAANTGHMVGEAPRAKAVIDQLNILASLVGGRHGGERRGQEHKPTLWERLRPGATLKSNARAKA